VLFFCTDLMGTITRFSPRLLSRTICRNTDVWSADRPSSFHFSAKWGETRRRLRLSANTTVRRSNRSNCFTTKKRRRNSFGQLLQLHRQRAKRRRSAFAAGNQRPTLARMAAGATNASLQKSPSKIGSAHPANCFPLRTPAERPTNANIFQFKLPDIIGETNRRPDGRN